MGTNFYAENADDSCPCCGRSGDEVIHIGKRSAGWPFLLHSVPELGIETAEDWFDWLLDHPKYAVCDEYGRRYTAGDMYEIITTWGDGVYDTSEGEFS